MHACTSNGATVNGKNVLFFPVRKDRLANVITNAGCLERYAEPDAKHFHVRNNARQSGKEGREKTYTIK